ncbi:glutathione transferase GST 23-like [Rutidosis leptorrhynchoides]|uniref:glutathione transferase GST 23-like n=1 Tax=Rutidosis leptorrhynchoides TaxID=125765 RepID=UPI003A9A1929
MSQDKVKLIGYWSSPFALQVQWALSLKGIKYEYTEKGFINKGPMLLQYHPVHKKIPILLHNDDVWKNHWLLPEDPLEMAQFRFWAKYVDDKCANDQKTVEEYTDQNENDAEEARNILKTLERSLDPNRIVSGDKHNLSFMDIVIAWVEIWFRVLENSLDVKTLDEENTPLLNKWFRDVLEVDVIKECLPPFEKMVARYKDLHEHYYKSSLSRVSN